MAPVIAVLRDILGSSVVSGRHAGPNASPTVDDVVGALSSLATRAVLRGRDTATTATKTSTTTTTTAASSTTSAGTYVPGHGVTRPADINDTAVFVVFGLLGAAIVGGIIWFFFWAKNGGFFFRKDDWDDYKSTVLRRRGPNGTLLTGATPSTMLGGGSVYKDVDDATTTKERDHLNDDNTTVLSGTTGLTGITGITPGASDIGGRERRRRKRDQKERDRERRREEKRAAKEASQTGKPRRKVGADGALIDEEAEAEAKAHLRSYREEKAARVGGINKQSDASTWDGSTNPGSSQATSSVGGSQAPTGLSDETVTTAKAGGGASRDRATAKKQQHANASANASADASGASKTATSGIRKVYSMADKQARREDRRLRDEARQLAAEQQQQQQQQKARPSAADRRSNRRDFSWQRGADSSTTVTGSSVSASTTSSSSTAPLIPNSGAGRTIAPLRRIEETDYATAADPHDGDHDGDPAADLGSQAPTSSSWMGPETDSGTKVYYHSVHVPGASSSVAGATAVKDFAASYFEDKRKKRSSGAAGTRRARGADTESVD